MTISSKKGRLHRTRNLASISLVAAAAAGAICTEAGISTAAIDPAATTMPTHTTDEAASDTFDWSVTNRTGQPIYGTWEVRNRAGRSHVESSVDKPWIPGDHANSNQRKVGLYEYDLDWKGVICYNENTWVFEKGPITTDFSLEVDSRGVLHAIYYTSDILGVSKQVVPFVRKGACQAPVG
ncbi:hypothetical protein [Rhodococcus jostii]|uniref:hypothetical protein n=1 Tax=Rhodococcus jostii TaxID=132919 RepID=UPI003630EDF1